MKLNSSVLSSTATLAGGGIDAAKISAIPAARKLARQAVPGTSDRQIITQRREIQFAAAADWPHTDPTNASLRVDFKPPPVRVIKCKRDLSADTSLQDARYKTKWHHRAGTTHRDVC
jgi:hypothetical protein